MKAVETAIALLLTAGLVLIIEQATWSGGGASLLCTLTIWSSIAQGALALVAACELTRARWIQYVRTDLLRFTPMLLLTALLFPALGPSLSIYPWSQAPTFWLSPDFFILRNCALSLLCWLAARTFALHSNRRSAQTGFFAVVYLFAFILCQSFIAFDWVMSLDYPWRSTLFGLYFAIEALLAAIALSALLLAISRRSPTTEPSTLEARRDLATLLFGFSILWAGLFFSQFLVIWYGNLPEERGFLFIRGWTAPYQGWALLFLAGIFLLPFGVFLSRRAKEISGVVSAVAAVVLGAFALERWIFIAPQVAVSVPALLLESLLFAALSLYLVTADRAPAASP